MRQSLLEGALDISRLQGALFKKRYELLECSGKIDQLDLKNPKEDITLMELGETELAGCFYQAALHVTKKRKRTAIKMIRIWYYQHETDGEKLGCNKELLATGDDLRKRSGYPVVRISCKDNEFSEFNIYTFARHLTGGQFDNGGPLVVDCICTKRVLLLCARLSCKVAMHGGCLSTFYTGSG